MSHKVQVRLFGAFRKLGNGRELEIAVPANATVKDLRAALRNVITTELNRPAEAPLVDESAIASDQSILAEDEVIPSGARLAILPPVCGG